MEFKSRAVRYPCGLCKIKCANDCVKCATCKLWFHSKCQSVSENELSLWGNLDVDYICVHCRTVDGSRFDYFMGMERLRKAAATRKTNELRQAAQREMMFKAKLELPSRPEHEFPGVDVTAAQVIDSFVDDFGGDPRITTGDGDCLFNAVSILLTGNEALSVSLRYHTCLNLVNKMTEYMLHPLRRQIQRLSSSYDNTCLATAKIGTASNSWTVLALADAVSRPIRIIYPYANGKKDVAYTSLNTVFVHNDSSGEELAILWHRMGCVPEQDQYYEVNHFSAVTDVEPLATTQSPLKNASQQPPKRSLESEEIHLDSEDAETWSIPKRVRQSPNSSFLEEEIELKTTNRFHVFSDCESDAEIEENYESVDVDFNCDDPSPNTCPHTDDRANENKNVSEESNKMINNNGSFLANEEILNLLKDTESPCTSIPKGTKNNAYVVVDYKQDAGEKNAFVDDCGVWVSGTTVNQYFVVTENAVKNVYKKNGLFCLKKIVNKKLTYIPLKPQPEGTLTLHRYYAQLKADSTFRRRISIVSNASECLSHLNRKCVVEYIGQRNSKKPSHGNSTTGESYTRTHPSIIKNAASLVGERSASQVVNDIAKENSPLAPKNAKQVQDRITYEKNKQKQKKNPITNTVPRRNLSDDLLTVLGELNVHEFVQQIVLTKGKPALVILYNENQIKNMKSNCEGEKMSVIGVDRTFNLGRFFVTAMSFKNRTVISRKTKQYPIFLGPICVQWDGEQASYQQFFDHVRDKLSSTKFTFGTDDEKAMRNALKLSFPDSDFLLCTKHIKDNIKHYLEKNGTEEKIVKQIISTIFDETSGLVFSRNDFEYLQREDDLYTFLNTFPKIQNYYDKFLAEKLRDFVYKPLKDKKISQLWTNNNAESMNNRLKQETQHKILTVPDLIDKLSSVAEGQLINLRRALYGNGNYKLFGKSEKLLLEEDIWAEKNEVQKQTLFNRLLTMSVRTDTDSDFLISADGHLKMKRPRQNAGKKPGQRRRPAAERVTNVNNR